MDIFRSAGPAYRVAHAGHLSLQQLKAMTAIEHCLTAALGGHVEACEADLLPVGYFHVVFTLPAEVADIAFQNKAAVYDFLFRAVSAMMLTIAADPRHLGTRIDITAVVHTWGASMTHHPHVHMLVSGGGIANGGERWISSRPAFLLPMRVLGRSFRRLFLSQLLALYDARRLSFFGKMAALAERRAFLRYPSPVRKKNWVVYAKLPFAGPDAILANLSRYTHRVAISNRRLRAFDDTGVTMPYKDCRRDGADRQRVMTLSADAFIRRFLFHILPCGFHPIRHYGLLAGSTRKAHLALARELLKVAPKSEDEPVDPARQCQCCGGKMIVIETFMRWCQARAPPSAAIPTRVIAS